MIAQTGDEAQVVNDAIRDELNKTGKFGSDHPHECISSIDSTDAQKHDPHFYQPGRCVYFLRNCSRYVKGDVYEVIGASDHGITLMKDRRSATICYRYTDRLTLMEAEAMSVAKVGRL